MSDGYVKVKRLLLLLLILCSCGTFRTRTVYIAPELLQYVELFESYYGTQVGVDVIFEHLPGTWAGVCHKRENHNTIAVDYTVYDLYKDNSYAIEEIVLHELGHCVLYRKHDDTVGEEVIGDHHYTKPRSIMYSSMFGSSYMYSKYHIYYLEELFGRDYE
jgi:hypothetical protein